MFKNFPMLIILAIIPILAILGWVFYLYQSSTKQPTSISSQSQASPFSSYLSAIKLPKESTSSAKVAKNLGSYTLGAATSSATNQTLTFKTKNSSTPFSITPVGNRMLGEINTSSVKEEKNGKIVYEDIYNGVDLIYTPSKDVLLEEYELKNKRQFTEIIQKIDLEGLRYEKQKDGSILFFKQSTTNQFAFAIPKPVMYEKGDTRQRSYGLHYEVIEQNGNTFLIKVIDQAGQDWLKKSAYPVMIDSTIFLTLFAYESYPVVDNNWTIRLDTVGTGDLTITPSFTTSDGGNVNKEKVDSSEVTLTCGSNNIIIEQLNNYFIAKNFSCSDLTLLNFKVITEDLDKQLSVNIEYGKDDSGSPYSTTVTTSVYTGKPVILSASVNPPTPKVGDKITVKTEVADQKGIKEVKADMAGIETIPLSLISGTATHGVYQGDWIVRDTEFKQYPVTLITTNYNLQTTTSTITIFDAYTCTGGGDHGGADWNPQDDCSGGIAGVHTNIGTFTVDTTIPVQAYSDPDYGSLDISATTVTISGTLNGDGKGFAGGVAGSNGSGSGGGTATAVGNWSGGGGGSHGGTGKRATGGAPGAGSTTLYGSAAVPVSLGSGGGGGGFSAGGAGGGVIKITASGTMTISGAINANGGVGGSSNGAGGGGSGGSIYLTAGTLSGDGTISANGGNGGDGNGDGGGGGGGRISLNYSSSYTYSSTPTVNTGSFGTGGSNGTIARIDTGNNDLYIKYSQTWSANSSADGSTFTYRNIDVQDNSTWTLKGYYTTDNNGVGFTFNVTNFTIDSGSTVDVDGQGYAGGAAGNPAASGSGPEGGDFSNHRAGGGGYGGTGGNGSIGGIGGGTYGSSSEPIDLGSGGSGGKNYAGGSGGGAVKIIASGTIDISGTLSADGGSSAGTYWAGGGGSGGSIYLTTGILSGGGTVTANGGSGLDDAGGGGGGRIAISYSSSYTAPTTLTASGGTGANAGGDGTITVESSGTEINFDGGINMEGINID